MMARYRMDPMGMFEPAPVGIPIVLAGLAYMYLAGRRLLPDRHDPRQPAGGVGFRPYLTEILILPDSPLRETTLGDSGLARDLDLTVMQVIRGKIAISLVPRVWPP